MSHTGNNRRAIRALFIDIDGTLVGPGDRISRRVQAAVAAAREAGCEVVLCTGRTRFNAQPVAEQLHSPAGFLVASNGGVAMHLGTGEVLHSRRMPVPLALTIIRTMVEVGAEPYVYEDATLPGIENARVLYHADLPIGEWAIPPRYRPQANLLDHLPFAPVSVSTFGSIQRVRPLAGILQERLPNEVSLVQTGTETTWGVEVYVANVSKQIGLEAVAARLGVPQEETMAIGDHFNDIEMLRWAGVGVAMGNALPEVKSAADHVTGHQHEDGVAQAIEQFVL